MTADDLTHSWWGLPTDKPWLCPACKVASPPEAWTSCEPYCEDCGSHDGRTCPNCSAVYDHVWGAEKLLEAQK